jgi:hypothetical protein
MATIEEFHTTTTDGFRFTTPKPLTFLKNFYTPFYKDHFEPYLQTMVSKVFPERREAIEVFSGMVSMFELCPKEEYEFIMYQLYCIIIRYIKEFHKRIKLELNNMLKDFEDKVAKGKITEQEFIEFCNKSKNITLVMNEIIVFYKDDKNIYFIENPDDKSLTVSINILPHRNCCVKYMFNYDMEKRRCIALKDKMDDKRIAKQKEADQALLQVVQEQKAKSKKQSIQDLTRKANKKKAEEQRLRKEYEKSAAEKELEKLKDKKKKQQKKSSKA